MTGTVRSWKLGGAIAAGAVALTACSSGNAENGPIREYSVVEVRDIDVRVEATGNINPIKMFEVKSKASGEVTAVHVESGDDVQQGDLLVEIDPRDVNTAYEQALADKEVTEARFNISKSQLANTQALYEAGFVTQQELQSAELSVANDSASYIRALTSLELANQRKNDVVIRAPISGTVIAESLEVGAVIASASQNVSGGTVLLTMADLSQMQVRALIDETDLGQVQVGLPVTMRVDAFPNRDFLGEVMKIEPMAVNEQNVTMFPVIVVLDNTEKLLKPGMNADVQIEVARREQVVAVSSAAVVEQRTAVAAGGLLGLSEDEVNTALRGGRGGAETEAPSAECVALRMKVQENGAESLTEEERGALQACPPQGQQQVANSGRRGGRGGARGGRGGRGGGRGSGITSRPGRQETRSGVVFVTDGGIFTARRVSLGVNDWEYTEVLSGLEPGDSVVLISVAQLQEAQQNFTDRMRDRARGFPGSDPRGGGGGGGRRGRND